MLATRQEFLLLLKDIKLVVMDFDGIMTDGYVYIDQDGKESVRCSRKDSLGLAMLKKQDIKMCVISKEANPVVSARCKKLNIPYFQKVYDGQGKLEILEIIAKNFIFTPKQILYMGDDINDILPMQYTGVGVTVADGHPKVKEIAHYITNAKGGEHAVREVAELILEAQGIEPEF